MKKSLIALAAMTIMASSAFATGSGSTYTPTVTGTGSNTVFSSTGVSAVSNGGLSTASATNTQSAAAWVGGTGSYSSGGAYKVVTPDGCEPVKVGGTLTLGAVESYGGVAVSGRSTAAVTGNGTAQGVGYSLANVEGATSLVTPRMSLEAGGNAGALVQTDTGVVTSGSSLSSGATGAGWNASQTGSLFTYNTNGVAGDVKDITSVANTYAGATYVYTPGNACQPGQCNLVTSAPAVGALTVVNSGAGAYTNGSVENTFVGAVKK